MRFVCLAALLAVALAAPARAQDRGPPTKLWSEFPLAPRVERRDRATSGRCCRPRPLRALQLRMAGCTGAYGSRSLCSVPSRFSGAAHESRGRSLRPARECSTDVHSAGECVLRARVCPSVGPTEDRVPGDRSPLPRQSSAVPAQYAPPIPLEEPEVEDEPRRFVMRRTGLLRCRFVVLANELDGQPSERARSRSFSKIGSAAGRERVAEDAWDDLMNDLRLAGWEPAQRRSRLLRFAPANRRRRRVAGHADDRRIHARPRRSVRRLTPRRDTRRRFELDRPP